MKALPRTANELVGTYRTFGTEGPAYQVLAKSSEEKVRIVVLESGEELEYPVRHALDDPEAE
jgi:hypothetical protein